MWDFLRIFKDNVSRDTELRFYKTMAKPVLLYGDEAHTDQQTEKKNSDIVMAFLQKVESTTSLNGVRNIGTPVSYTHLDVYKRQYQNTISTYKT